VLKKKNYPILCMRMYVFMYIVYARRSDSSYIILRCIIIYNNIHTTKPHSLLEHQRVFSYIYNTISISRWYRYIQKYERRAFQQNAPRAHARSTRFGVRINARIKDLLIKHIPNNIYNILLPIIRTTASNSYNIHSYIILYII